MQQRQWTTPAQSSTTVQGTANSYGNVGVNPYGATYRERANLSGTATTTYTPPQTQGYTARRTFFINAEGIVYRYAWQGL